MGMRRDKVKERRMHDENWKRRGGRKNERGAKITMVLMSASSQLLVSNTRAATRSGSCSEAPSPIKA